MPCSPMRLVRKLRPIRGRKAAIRLHPTRARLLLPVRKVEIRLLPTEAHPSIRSRKAVTRLHPTRARLLLPVRKAVTHPQAAPLTRRDARTPAQTMRVRRVALPLSPIQRVPTRERTILARMPDRIAGRTSPPDKTTCRRSIRVCPMAEADQAGVPGTRRNHHGDAAFHTTNVARTT